MSEKQIVTLWVYSNRCYLNKRTKIIFIKVLTIEYENTLFAHE